MDRKQASITDYHIGKIIIIYYYTNNDFCKVRKINSDFDQQIIYYFNIPINNNKNWIVAKTKFIKRFFH